MFFCTIKERIAYIEQDREQVERNVVDGVLVVLLEQLDDGEQHLVEVLLDPAGIISCEKKRDSVLLIVRLLENLVKSACNRMQMQLMNFSTSPSKEKSSLSLNCRRKTPFTSSLLLSSSFWCFSRRGRLSSEQLRAISKHSKLTASFKQATHFWFQKQSACSVLEESSARKPITQFFVSLMFTLNWYSGCPFCWNSKLFSMISGRSVCKTLKKLRRMCWSSWPSRSTPKIVGFLIIE